MSDTLKISMAGTLPKHKDTSLQVSLKNFITASKQNILIFFKVKNMACGLIDVLQTNTNENKLDILHPMENNYFEKIYSQ